MHQHLIHRTTLQHSFLLVRRVWKPMPLRQYASHQRQQLGVHCGAYAAPTLHLHELESHLSHGLPCTIEHGCVPVFMPPLHVVQLVSRVTVGGVLLRSPIAHLLPDTSKVLVHYRIRLCVAQYRLVRWQAGVLLILLNVVWTPVLHILSQHVIPGTHRLNIYIFIV